MSFEVREGAIRLRINATITPRELASWSPERITKFFGGIAEVIKAAKGGEVIQMADDPKDEEKDQDPDKKDEQESDRGKDPQAP